MDDSPYRSPQSVNVEHSPYGAIKLVALLAIILLVAQFFSIFLLPGGLVGANHKPVIRIVNAAILICGYLSVLFLIVDAFRREYHSPRTLPIALAIGGLFSFGICSLIYFVFWGRHELHVRYADSFCGLCCQESAEYDRPLDLSTINFVNGGRFVGSARKCRDCGSSIRTHVFYLFGIPLFSHGSFRVQYPAMARCIVRKTAFYWPHLLNIAGIPLVLFGLAAFLFWARR